MLSIKTSKPIVLHTGDFEVTYQFEVEVCSSVSANDGTIGYGRTVSSVAVSVTDEDDAAVTDLVDTYSVTDNIISIAMTYPAVEGDGTYKIKCIMTLDNSSKIEWMVYVYCESH